MKLTLPKLAFLFAFSIFLVSTAHATAPKALANRTCCTVDPATGGASGNCDGCRADGIETKNNGDSCGGAANCEVCPASHPKSNQCGGSTTTNPSSCTQAVYALENPTNLNVGQSKDFYADGHANNSIFAKMVATVANVPLGGAAVASVITTGGPTCYSTNGNCRQNFRVTGRSNGTALLNVTTQVKLCPACAISGSCTRTITVNVGGVTALACKPGAKCTVQTLAGTTSTVGGTVNCSMPALSTAELNGGSASYQVQCTPYRGTVAQAVISKSSANGSFPSVYKMVKGVTEVRCSFRYCVTGSDKVTKCSDWGKAS